MSLACASSMPEEAARLKMPGSPAVICWVSHPASAIYFSAWADSDAVNCVLAPYSFAVSVRASSSFPVAPDNACTSDMDAVKSMPVCRTEEASPFSFSPTPETRSDTMFTPTSNPAKSNFELNNKLPSACGILFPS